MIRELHRRRRLRALALFAAIVAVCAGCDWQMLGYGPAHTSFNPTESAISVANVAGLVRRYPPSNTSGNCVVPCSSPAVANGSVYVGAGSDLVVRDAHTGDQQWSGHTGAAIWSSPTVVDGVVYIGSDDAKLYAFDAAGTTNCSGSPKRCAPLWTANAMTQVRSSPTVANGVVYVAILGGVLAFDAAGTTNCSGSPKVCNLLWATTFVGAGRTPAVANGVLYVSGDQLYAFDAAGTINCSASAPKLCAPLWTGSPGTGSMVTPPAVANGMVYVAAQTFGGPFLEAFSAAGTTNCSGTPKVCTAIWAGSIRAGSLSVTTTPAIANGVAYITAANIQDPQESLLTAYDAAGITNCSPVFGYRQCTPLWTAEERVDNLLASPSPAVANGVVYVTYAAVNLDCLCVHAGIRAYDATGTANCSGTPKICSTLWSDLVGLGTETMSSPIVANGAVYFNAATIYKYALSS